MLWLKLGWRNLWRNRRRSVIELVSIGGSVFLGVIWNNIAVGSYDDMIDNGVRMGSGHIGIYHTGYLEERKTEQLVVNVDQLVREVSGIPGVVDVFPRLQVPGLVNSARESRGTGILGMDIDREKATNPIIAEKRIIAGTLPESGNTALLGVDLARELDLEVGNKFVIMAQDINGEIASRLFRVAGIVRTNVSELDASVVIVDRGALGDFIGSPDSAHEVAVILRNHTLIPQVYPRIEEIVKNYPGAAAYRWQDAMKDLAASIQIDHVGLVVMVIILYSIVGIGTVNTILMSIMERSREFGVIRAIGLNRMGIRKIVITEAFVLACAGVVCGYIASILLGLYTSIHGIDMSGLISEQSIGGILFEPILYSAWDIRSMAVMGVGMILIALAASLYPAHYVLKIRPAEAMRKY